jgi:hypothetical protein
MMLSNGEIIDRPRFLGASTERVKRLQRSLSLQPDKVFHLLVCMRKYHKWKAEGRGYLF